ncbi:MAG: LysE family transporter [Salinirussus sp.]
MATTLVSGGAGVIFGLALAAPPGPMNAVIAEESVLRGWMAGVRAGLGAMSADACFLVLSLAGVVAVIRDIPTLRASLTLAGGVVMWYFAAGAARGAKQTLDPGGAPTGESKGFRKAFVLALTNPYQILFWLTVGVGLLAPGQLDLLSHVPYIGEQLTGFLVVQTGSPALIIGFFTGIAVWVAGFPAALVAARRRVGALAPAIAVASAVLLAAFGTVFLLDGLAGLR